MAGGRLLAGTSGFAYREWKPDFYPADLKPAQMLAFYAKRLTSVEINNTFYRMPSAGLLEGWKAQTPESFVFTLKAPRRITHIKRLADVADPVAFFLDSARHLGERLGCILFQCPPFLRYRAGLLDGFLEILPERGFRFAMEFRHESWDSPEVRDRLAARGIALCCVERDDDTDPLIRTAGDFVYLRLRKPGYTAAELQRWARRLREILDDGADAYVYLKHEDDPRGALAAERLLELAG